MDRTGSGVLALSFALASILSPFVTASIFEHSPGWIFPVGAALAGVAIWLGIRAAMAERGTPGRGLGITGIVLGVFGIGWTAFIAIVGMIVESDTTL